MTIALTAESPVAAVIRGRVHRARRRRTVIAVLTLVLLVAFAVTLMVGRSFTPPGDVIRVLLGQSVPGASFTVGVLRLPRAVLSIVTGMCFGLGGIAFQTMLRNPLASPDIIGISRGASAAAVFAIVILTLQGTAVSMFAIAGALGVGLLVYLLSFKGGVVGTRLILIGIGVAAVLHSVTSYVLTRAASWGLNEATRWLTGSVNGATWADIVPTLVAVALFAPLLLSQSRSLDALRLGDDTAAALGVRVARTRILVIIAATGMIAFATAAAGPIAFVAFLAGPIAARLVGPNGSLIIPAGLVGAALVLVADYCGQFAFGSRYPVGVVTGALGAPYLIYLIVRSNQAGGSL